MLGKKYNNSGPIGTKLGTFIVDENLETVNKYVPILLYDKYLIESINFGVKWLFTKIEGHTGIGDKYTRYRDKFIKLINDDKYSDDLNQQVIEITHDLSSKLNRIKAPELARSDKGASKNNNHLGPSNLDDILENDVDFTRGLMVQTVPGRYELFLYVRHSDHYDILPYEFIVERLKTVPNLLINGYKVN